MPRHSAGRDSVARSKKAEVQGSAGRTRELAAGGNSGADRAAARSANAALVTLDRRTNRDRRKPSDRRKTSQPVAVERRKLQRRAKVVRRRQIDPTTCERDYSSDEIEFMAALDAYKRSSGRMFPTCSEILEVLRNLGYEKRPPAAPVAQPASEPATGQPKSSATPRHDRPLARRAKRGPPFAVTARSPPRPRGSGARRRKGRRWRQSACCGPGHRDGSRGGPSSPCPP